MSGHDDTLRPLSNGDKRELLGVARDSITRCLRDGGRITRAAGCESPLAGHRAAFVTLRTRDTGELRGCRGEVAAWRPLIDSVARMAISAATDDSRFAPVQPAELPGLHIEINALGPSAPIAAEEIVVGRHGLIIRFGETSGLLLPEVPVTHGWDRDAFLTGLCRKADLPADAWRRGDTELLAFETESWGEEK